MNDTIPGAAGPPDSAGDEGPAGAEEPVSEERPPAEPSAGEPAPRYEPAAPRPLGVPREPTGDAEVDAGLDRLADADDLATDGHIEVYEDVHRGLRDALTALDARQGPPAPAPGQPGPAAAARPSPYHPSPSGTPTYDNRS